MHGKQKELICPLCADIAATYTFREDPEKESWVCKNIVYSAR